MLMAIFSVNSGNLRMLFLWSKNVTVAGVDHQGQLGRVRFLVIAEYSNSNRESSSTRGCAHGMPMEIFSVNSGNLRMLFFME